MTRREEIELAWLSKAVQSNHRYDEKTFKEAVEWADKTMIEKACELMMNFKIKMAGFISLVKRMREAQKQWKDGDPFDGTEMELAKRMCEAEREVDEYLKKIESIDQRKALEAENTEFEYVHNVKHYREN